ncbi:response regulator transcription factor [Streptomyces mexicanus]|uniref:response regulator transcription factor n=1 Tax=Streptomyces mexicanus TaxID=178566 RepID=UPI0036666960
MVLNRRDYESLLDLAFHALRQDGVTAPWPGIAQTLADHLDAAAVTFTEIDRGRGRPLTWSPAGLPGHRVHELSRRSVRAHNPLIAHYGTVPDTTPRTAEDLTGRTEWRDSPARSVARHYFGADHVLAVPCARDAGIVRGFVVYRTARFAPAQRQYLTRAQPLLAAVDAQDRVMARVRAPGAEEPLSRAREYGLTQRELSVLTLLGEALPAKAIATRLGVSPRTVHKHVQHVYRKLGTNDRMGTVLLAQSLGLLAPARPAGGAGAAPVSS